VTLPCRAESSYNNVTYQWYRNDVNVQLMNGDDDNDDDDDDDDDDDYEDDDLKVLKQYEEKYKTKTKKM